MFAGRNTVMPNFMPLKGYVQKMCQVFFFLKQTVLNIFNKISFKHVTVGIRLALKRIGMLAR